MSDPLEKKPRPGGQFVLWFSFQPGLSPAGCYCELFRAIPLHRLNGVIFLGERVPEAHNEPAQEPFKIGMLSHSRMVLGNYQRALCNTNELKARLEPDSFSMGPASPRDRIPLASISGGKVIASRKMPPVVAEGADMAAGLPPYQPVSLYPPDPCAKCGAETEGRAFCPSCGRQHLRLNASASIYLVAMLGLTAFQFFQFFGVYQYKPALAFQGIIMGGGTVILSFFVMLAELVLLVAATIQLFRYRKAGFKLFAIAKLAPVAILPFTGTIFADIFSSLLFGLVFVFMAAGLLGGDFPHME